MLIPIITYTNNKCSDVWPVYMSLLKKFYGNPQHTFLLDDTGGFPFMGLDYFIYSNNDPFYDVWLRCLSNYKSEFFLYMQEDFFLYKPVKHDVLNFYLDVMKKNPHISCIRLLKSGIHSKLPVENIPTLYYIDYDTDYAFSMQPTIWRTTDFLKLQETKIQISPWDEGKLNGDVLSKLDLSSLYHYNNEPKRGMSHYDSNVFSYIASALVKGKWNTREYPELIPILKTYGIDISIRGEYKL